MTAPATAATDREAAIGFVLALGSALHRYGTPAHGLEESLARVAAQLELDAEVFSTPTSLIMSFGPPSELKTRMLRVEGGELDMGKLAQLDELSDRVAARDLHPDEAMRRLTTIVAGPHRFGRAVSALMHAVTSGALVVFFGGSIHDIALAGAVGLALGALAQVMKRSSSQARVFELVGAAFCAFAPAVVSSVTDKITPSLITLSALIVLLPGLQLGVAMTELATHNLIAGTARLMSAVIVLIEIVIGVALGERGAAALVEVHQAVPVPWPEGVKWLALGASSLGIAILVQAQVRAFVWIFAGCVCGYMGSRIGIAWFDSQLGVLVGAFAVGVLSNLYARLLRRPAQVVQVPAMFLMVPGGLGFRGLSSLLQHDTLTGVDAVFAMLVIAVAIAAGLLLATAVMSPRSST